MKNNNTQTADTMLNNDRGFCKNYSRARANFTSGVIPAALFNNIVEWQIGDCFRRKGLPLRQARVLKRAATCRLTMV